MAEFEFSSRAGLARPPTSGHPHHAAAINPAGPATKDFITRE
jgi:hypothetical protein